MPRLPDSEGELPLMRVLRRKPLTPQRAAMIIGAYTLVVTVAAAIVMRLVDKQDFSSTGESFWWAVQTVTTVGYGDVTPQNTGGQVVAAILMVTGIAFLTVITASVTAALIEAARRRAPRAPSAEEREASARDLAERLDRIEAQLARLADRADQG